MSILRTIQIAQFLDHSLVGGTTRPLLVVGEDGNTYVLKLFSKNDAEQRSYTVAEVMANLLAKQFDLFVPEAIYMFVSDELLSFVRENQPELYDLLSQKEVRGPQFACRYYAALPLYSPTREDKYLDLHEFESIFAFDMLISNDDRRELKPNILRGSSHYLLIDHEKAFEGLEVVAQNLERGQLPHHYSNHLFYPRLSAQAQKESNSVNFETFSEYFRNLNLQEITENVRFLIEKGYNEHECEGWLNYLMHQKVNYTNFVALLKQKISE
jgi:hypothetical protein